MEAAGFSAALGGFYNIHIHQNSTLHIHCHVNSRFCTISNSVSCRSILQS